MPGGSDFSREGPTQLRQHLLPGQATTDFAVNTAPTRRKSSQFK